MERSVVHVVESLGAGTATAVGQYVGVPDVEHRLLGRIRAGSFVAEPWLERMQARLCHSPLALLVLWLRERRRDVDVVHAHSTVAGLITRVFRHPTAVTVYSPHGMAALHHRRPLVRAVLQRAERLLARRADVIAVVGEAERAEVSALLPGARVVLVPHALVAPDGVRRRRDRAAAVVAVGRLSHQKAPETVADLPERLADLGLEWTWVGEGDVERQQALVAGGWTVLGWRPHAEVQKLVEDALVLLHPARYEGFPLAVVEALALGTPVVARAIGPLQGLAGTALFEEEGESAGLVRRLAVDGRAWAAAGNAGRRYIRRCHSPERQVAVLAELYR